MLGTPEASDKMMSLPEINIDNAKVNTFIAWLSAVLVLFLAGSAFFSKEEPE